MATPAKDDATLLARMGEKGDLALRALIGRHQVRVYRFVVRLVRDEAVA